MGSTIHTTQHFINMEGVIPNSKVVILPPPKDGEAWKRELFLRPGEWIPWVTLTVVAGTVLLAIIVFVLHLNEKVSGLPVSRCSQLLTAYLFVLDRGRMSWNEGGLHTISTLMHCNGLGFIDLYCLRPGWTCITSLLYHS